MVGETQLLRRFGHMPVVALECRDDDLPFGLELLFLVTARSSVGTAWNGVLPVPQLQWHRIARQLLTIRRDDHVDLDALTCIPGQDRRDRPFIVGVRPDATRVRAFP